MAVKPDAVDGRQETARYARWTFDTYRAAALDPSLSEHAKIGMPDAFREGFGEAIWSDILSKAPAFSAPGARLLDIGPGCGELPRRLISQAEKLSQSVTLVDHREMLDQLPKSATVTRIDGRFPDEMPAVEPFDGILIYSVLQTVFVEANPFAFVDAALALLKPGGQLLVGDVPNFSKLRRFLSSAAGVEHHKSYMNTDQPPDMPPFATAEERLDDGAVIGLLLRARSAGFDAYALPQPAALPLSNRREDLLFVRP